MARTTIAKAMALTDLYGRPLWVPQMTVGAPSMLLGLPIREFNDLAAPSASSLSILCADFQEAYQIVDRTGIRILRNPFASLGSVGFYTTKRVGGDVVNTEAIKVGKLAVS
jgi:HK97 family phage major capsid protein